MPGLARTPDRHNTTHNRTPALKPATRPCLRVFANGPGDLGSIPGRVIPKTQKMVLDASLLNTQHYKVRIKGKVEQSREGVAPSPTHWCSSYRKGSLRVTLDYGRQLYYLYIWTLTKRLEKKLDGNYTRMFRAILNKSWRQLYGHLPPITKTIQVRRARHAGHCWRSKDELVSDVLLWTPTYGQAKAGRPARTYIQQLCEDTGCNPEDLPEAMNDREKWREMVKDIRAGGMTWWWWWWYRLM